MSDDRRREQNRVAQARHRARARGASDTPRRESRTTELLTELLTEVRRIADALLTVENANGQVRGADVTGPVSPKRSEGLRADSTRPLGMTRHADALTADESAEPVFDPDSARAGIAAAREHLAGLPRYPRPATRERKDLA